MRRRLGLRKLEWLKFILFSFMNMEQSVALDAVEVFLFNCDRALLEEECWCLGSD